MLRRALLAITLLMLGPLTCQAGLKDNIKSALGLTEEPQPKSIKVLLEHDVDGAMLQVTGGYNIFDPKSGRRLGTRFVGKNMFVQPLQNGLRWGEEFPGIYQIVLVPDHPDITVLVNGMQYKGSVYVYQIQNRISIVNEVPIEDFIRSTLSPQFKKSLGSEVMAAVAITARTDAYYLADHGSSPFWDVDAKEVGYDGESVTGGANGVAKAIASTSGMVMQYGLGRGKGAFAARWTENSAGKTVPYHVMFRRDANGPVDGTTAPIAARDVKSDNWSFSLNVDELAKMADLRRITAFELYADKPSDKVYAVRLYDGNQFRDIDFITLQEKVGKDKLKSSQFQIDIRGGVATVSGVGEGHGVGLCLKSAQKMQERGFDARAILTKFFPGASLEMLPVENKRQSMDDIAEEDVRPSRYRRQISS